MCMYFIEYNGTLNLNVHMTTCFCITHHSNVTKVPPLLTVNTYIQFQIYYSILTLKTFINVFTNILEIIWDPIMYSAYFVQINVGLGMVQEETETCSRTGMLMIVYVVVFRRSKPIDFILRIKSTSGCLLLKLCCFSKSFSLAIM